MIKKPFYIFGYQLETIFWPSLFVFGGMIPAIGFYWIFLPPHLKQV
jgi:hypothetical protein